LARIIDAGVDASHRVASKATTGLSLIPGFVRHRFLEQVQCGVDVREKTLDFIALVGTGAFLQPVQQLLFSRKEVCSGCHVLWCFHTSQARPRLKGGLGWAGTVQASGAGPVTRSLTPVSLGVFLAILQQMARPELAAVGLVAFQRAPKDGAFKRRRGASGIYLPDCVKYNVTTSMADAST